MKSDFEMIVHKLDTELKHINIYPLGDLHIGSADFNMELWKQWKYQVMNDPNGYWVYVGDLMDNGLKNSKTNVYEATMTPFQQKEWLKREFAPIKHKNLGGVDGNHEERSVRETSESPVYDVMCKLDVEDLYRHNMAFMKINLGYRNKERQHSYMFVLSHGASRIRANKFSYTIDGMDVLITGHTHTPSSDFPSKIVIDSKNEIVKMSDYVHLVVPSFAKYGGYAMRAMYLPQSQKIPMLTLSGEKKEVKLTWI